MIVPTGLFEITDHLHHARRGPLLVGHIKSGLVQPGMGLALPPGDSYVISAVEYMDNLAQGQRRVALFLEASPAFEALKEAFPKGAKAVASTRKQG